MSRAAAYLDQLFALLPPGAAWVRTTATVLGKILAAASQEFSRLHARALQLRDEADPRKAFEMLEEWEETTSLPDTCMFSEQTLETRRNRVVAALTAEGGIHPAYYIALAAAIGYDITITEPQPFAVDNSAVEDALYDENARFLWIVNTIAAPVWEFAVDDGAVGDPLEIWAVADLECLIRRANRPTRTVWFNYL